MSSFLYRLGRWSFRSWKIVVAAWVALATTVVSLGFLLFGGLSTAFDMPGTEAQKGIDYLADVFPQLKGGQGIFLAVAKPGHKVTEPAAAAQIRAMSPKLYELPDVALVLLPGQSQVAGNPLTVDGNITPDGSAAIIQLQMTEPTTEVPVSVQHRLTKLAKDSSNSVLEWHSGGAIYSPPQPGIKPTEVIGIVVAAVVLTITFRSVTAALLPMAGALFGAVVTIFSIVILTHWLNVSPTAPLVAIMIGLAVGIDYALFLVSRHRQQLAEGYEPEESAGLALATAGSAVAFAGLTVVLALAAMVVAKIPFLTTLGICGSIGVVVSVLITMTLIPACMGLLGHRLVPKQQVWPVGPRKGRRLPDLTGRGGAAYVRLVTKKPLLTILVVLPPLVLLALPALGLKLALPDGSEAEEKFASKKTFELVADKFGPGWNTPIIVTSDIITSLKPFELIASIRHDLEKVPGVERVAIATPNPPNGDAMVVQLYSSGSANSEQTLDLVKRLRALAPQFKQKYDITKRADGCRGGCDLIVTGYAAAAIDVAANIDAGMLPFAILVLGMAIVLLAMVMRSIFIPIKATLGFALSVGCGFGGVALVYNQGWFSHAAHTVHVGPIVSFGPMIILASLFGLAMDYEVFLVARMREDYAHHGDARGAILRGFESSARVVTAAAFIMVTVFVAFVPESDANVQPIAAGLAIGVLIDAFVVRMTLIPAVMMLAAERAWFIPRWLDRALPAFDVEGEGIHHQLALQDFPYPDAPQGIYAADLSLQDRGTIAYSGLNLSVEPSDLVLVVGSAHTRRALAQTVAGRVRPSAGQLKVAGHVLPQEAAVSRRHTAFVEIDGDEDVIRSLRLALRPHTTAIVVDGLENVPSQGDRQYLLDMVDGLCRERGVPAFVTTSFESLDHLHTPDDCQWLTLCDADPAASLGSLTHPARLDVETVPALEFATRIPDAV